MQKVVELTTSRRSVGRLVLDQDQEYGVGSAESNLIRIVASDVKPRHACFRYQGGLLYVEPIDSAPIMLNGQVVADASAVGDGDWVAFGTTLVQVRIPESIECSESDPDQPGLEVAAKDSSGEIVIGRSTGGAADARLGRQGSNAF